MKSLRPLTLTGTLALVFLLMGAQCSDEVRIDTKVDDQQKISDGAGNLDADLDDGDQFGSAIANLGDLEAGGVLVLDRAEVLRRCDAAGLFLWARSAAG